MTQPDEKRIILAIKHPGNVRVLEQAVAEVGLIGVAVASEEALREELSRNNVARSALLDVTGFGRVVWNMCELLQQHNVPFVVLSASQDHHVGNRSLAYGATSVLQKPVAKKALLQLVQNLYGDRKVS